MACPKGIKKIVCLEALSGPVTIAEIRRRHPDVSKGSFWLACRKLVGIGFISMERDKMDCREKIVSLTEAGKAYMIENGSGAL